MVQVHCAPLKQPPSETDTDPRDHLFDAARIDKRLGRRAGGASIFALAIAALKVLQQIASIAIIARLIPPSDYGIYAMALPGVLIASALSNFGLPQAIVQRKTISHAEVSVLFWLNLVFAMIVTAVLVSLAGPIATYYGNPEVESVFQVVSLSLLFSAASSQYLAILQRTLQIRAAELLTLLAEMIGLAVAITAAWLGMSYWALVLQQIVTPMLKTIFMCVRTGWTPSSPVGLDFRGSLSAVSFGGFVAGYSIVNRLTEYAGTVIVGARFEAAAAGLFYRTRNLSGLPAKRVMMPLSGVFVPTMSRLQDDAEALQAMFCRLISRANLILLPVAVLFAAGAEPLVLLLMGETWSAAAPFMLWMSIFTFREAGASGLQFVMIAAAATRPMFLFGLLRLILIVIVLYAAATHGLMAMIIAYVLAELFVTLPLMVLTAHRHTPISLGVFARACLFDMTFAAAVALVLIFGVNPHLDGLSATLHLAALMAIVTAVWAVRVLMSAGMRHDMLRVLDSVAGRLRSS